MIRSHLLLISTGNGDPKLPLFWRPLELLETTWKGFLKDVTTALIEQCSISEYLMQITKTYLSSRIFPYETLPGENLRRSTEIFLKTEMKKYSLNTPIQVYSAQNSISCPKKYSNDIKMQAS